MGTGSQNYTPPEHITSDFLQDVLKEYFKDETLEVKDLIIRSAGNGERGKGFASMLHRATFNLTKNSESSKFSVIIKDHPKGYMGAIALKSKLFKREILAYTEILPHVEALLNSIGDKTKIAPACYYTTESPEPFLILEDMTIADYDNSELGRLLNLEYVLPTIEKLAKLHACSAVIAAENPKLLEFFQEAPISRNPDRKDFLAYFPANVRTVAAETARWKGYEEITEKLYKLSENIMQNAVEMYESHSENFCVFTLSDLWINNLMFHINNEKKEPDDVVMVSLYCDLKTGTDMLDFQLSYYGPPAIDLNYFLFGSVNENVRKVHFKYIVHTYHRVLKETLEKLNYKGSIPSLKDLNIDLIKNSLQGVIAATCLTPIIFMELPNNANEESLFTRSEEGDEVRRRNAENAKYRTFLQRTVKEFELCGFLDS